MIQDFLRRTAQQVTLRLSDRPTCSYLVEMGKRGRITMKPSTEGSGTTDAIPFCMDAATIPERQKNA